MADLEGGRGCISVGQMRLHLPKSWIRHWVVSGVYNAKAEECTTPRIDSRKIKIKIGGGLPINQK